MFTLLSAKNYVIIAIFFAVILYVIQLTVGEDFANWAEDQQPKAAVSGSVVNAYGTVVTEAIIFVMTQNIVGAVVGGLMWPFVILWLILTPLLLVLISGVNVAGDVPGISRRYLSLTI
jgi:hypothetical protein